MKQKRIWLISFLGLLLLILGSVVQISLSQAGGQVDKPQQQSLTAYDYTDQLIVKYRNPSLVRTAVSNNNSARFMINERVNALSSLAGVALTHFRFMSGDGHVLKLPHLMKRAEAEVIARKLNASPYVKYAEPDARMFPMLTPNDSLYTNQWHYKTPGAPDNEPGGANLPGAWDITTGSSSIVVAVVDTGIVTHADLTRTVAGYNFISDAFMAGNGVGRSADPSDLGDWVAADECYSGSLASNSSWHGTHVAGTIGANTDNATGVAGINWISNILPVRVLGKCGGYLSDIADGMRWAAGLSVSLVPANANPAKVINLSLGGLGACGTTYQTAIDNIIAAGTTVVVAAGNENEAVTNHRPANCNGVISVAATNRTGGRAYYSNYGTIINIAAPGGEQFSSGDPNGVLSTLNSGTTTPVASPGGDIYQYYQGTSMATPHVAGIASLLLSVNSALLPAQVLALIQETARTFPTGTGLDCTTSTCGSGIIDAAAAVTLAGGSADLSLAIVLPAPPTSPPLLVGSPFTHTVTVTNNGTDSAPATLVTYTQSGTATIALVSATPSTGTCTGTSFVTCNLGTLVSGASATVTFIGTPTTTGTIIHTASASSAMIDPDLSDNSWIFNTSAENPVPVISSLSPSSATAGGTAFTLTVNGSNFVSNSTVQWDGTDRTTTFYSFTQLTVAISAADIATADTAAVTVVNPSPGGGTSSPSTFTISGTPAPAKLTSGNMCFIATAAFGSPLERHVQILRDFRDSYLLNFSAGKAFVNFYYEVSPPIAQTIAKNESLRLMTRWALMPIVGIAYLTIYWGVAATLFLLMIMLLTFIVLARTIRRKLRIV
jgi:serine protease